MVKDISAQIARFLLDVKEASEKLLRLEGRINLLLKKKGEK